MPQHSLLLRAAVLALALAAPAAAQPVLERPALVPPPASPSPASYPVPREADLVLHDFRFHDGTVLPELRLHYATVGDPSGEPVLLLHGTAGSGAGLLTPDFAGQLLGPGQPLDARHHFVILTDALGAGRSSKPSDGLAARFPAYDYDDMVRAQYRVVTEGLGLHHLRLVLGLSMGGMHAWQWGVAYPGFMDALVPMAAQPAPMSGRNWMLRHLLVEAIRRDPGFQGGNYTTEPASLQLVSVLYGTATSGGTLHDQAAYPSSAAADAYLDALLARPAPFDANDYLKQWNASRDYDPSAGLARITASVLAINSADDERNPPETGIMQRAMAQVPHGELYVVPASTETRGHGTLGYARFFAARLGEFLSRVPRLGS